MRPTLTFIGMLAGWATVSAAPPDPAVLASRIDERLAARWAAEKVKPAPPANDETFVRRVHLDLAGRIPTVAEVREFLADKSPNKRLKLVARLIDSPAHSLHFATFWRRQWIPQADTPQFANLADDVDGWLANELRTGVPYDRIVRSLLTAKRTRTGPGTPAAFLVASEFKPENLAANTAIAFLGINLDCAQCHDHPFARWTRDQFWQTAAFFASPAPGDGATPAKLELMIPNAKRVVGAKFLGDRKVNWPESIDADTGRTILAEWVTATDNRFFSHNAVNRVWANLFGTGLVEPLDDLSGENPASHPELLEELSRAFVESGFDLKFLTTAIVMTKAYQLSSVVPSSGGSSDPRLFARSGVRGLTGEQLYASLRIAAGFPPEREDLDPNALRSRRRFAERFRVERAGSAERSILQALSLMNGRLTAELTKPESTPTLRAVAGAPFLDSKGKVEALHLAALGRNGTDEEIALRVKHLEKGGADGDARKALADIFWALLNSSEFNTNH